MPSAGCISSVSYIKPQRHDPANFQDSVVYRPFPTSNHNSTTLETSATLLYIVRFLHQTTTTACSLPTISGCISSVSYIKPQPCAICASPGACCISSVSYIKPQLTMTIICRRLVVYRPFPTSNHNRTIIDYLTDNVVYRPFPTSNHNPVLTLIRSDFVVYRPFPTSNHNRFPISSIRNIVVYRPFPTSNHNYRSTVAL